MRSWIGITRSECAILLDNHYCALLGTIAELGELVHQEQRYHYSWVGYQAINVGVLCHFENDIALSLANEG